MRLFITSFAKIYEYEKFQKEINRYFEGKWTETKNIHITFKFLGEVLESKKVINALENISYPKNLKIEFDKLDLFEGRTKILYASTSFSNELFTLEEDISKRLSFLKFHSKDFIPHLALLRIKHIKDEDYKKYLEYFKNKKIGYVKLKLVLVKSTLTKNGPVYEVIKEF